MTDLLVHLVPYCCRTAVLQDGPETGMQHPDGAATAARLADWLSALLDELAAAPEAGMAFSTAAAMAVAPPQTIAVVASARAAASLHPSLRQVGRLDFEVRVAVRGSCHNSSHVRIHHHQNLLPFFTSSRSSLLSAFKSSNRHQCRIVTFCFSVLCVTPSRENSCFLWF